MCSPHRDEPKSPGIIPTTSEAAFWADATKARELLGWEATHTVEDMCRSSWQFVKNAGE